MEDSHFGTNVLSLFQKEHFVPMPEDIILANIFFANAHAYMKCFIT